MTYCTEFATDPIAPQQLHGFQANRGLEAIAHPAHALLRTVIESWVDGILILTEQGQWVEANESARHICGRLIKAQALQPSPYSSSRSQTPRSAVPQKIWEICQELIQSQQAFPRQPVIVESEIDLEGSVLRVRVRWFGVEATDRPYLMVILEDRHQTNLQRAIVEVDQFRLSPREAEVWLLYRTGHSYKKIAQELYICFDTVKKHLRSIRTKQQCAKLI
ncbi:MAG: LuxR family transcriptional regulator [Drouetiella hepatica Uher 2000/2452]|jgi:DNA-binding CsgD family transcriptional regulator|uniref:LuxR family transcriptional regulator n=1 Tax=Drouetiella hepatica Uher 2000/2452 TaxID=904376 RepID=A0A951UNE4_9CYAN|nr:LuxR family transcriptional regulator [Drouetiella hepatica Uher 2000/2452]